MKSLALFTLIFLLQPGSARAQNLIKVSIYDLEVTQKNVGFLEVEEKENNLHKVSDSKRKAYIKSEPVPVVIGPNEKMYMIYHHHLSRAVGNTNHD